MFRNKLWFVIWWGVTGAGLLAAVFWATGRMRQQFFHDFRGRALPVALRPFGPQAGRLIQKEAEGLRITLPKDRPEREPVGVTLSRVVPGDFEITATVEIVEVDEPPLSSFGAGILMTVDETARLGRLRRAKGQQVAFWDQWLFEDGKDPRVIRDAMPCTSNVVRLRMKRAGTKLSYLWAPDSVGDEFELMHESEYRPDDVKEIKVMAESGTPPSGLVDVRFLELRVATDSGVGPRTLWMSVATVLVVAGGLAGWRFVPSREVPPSPAPKQVAAGQAAAAPAVAVTCPHCQKRLKVSARGAGKKVTCPGCAAEFIARPPSSLAPG